jgi:hypothetical protein
MKTLIIMMLICQTLSAQMKIPKSSMGNYKDDVEACEVIIPGLILGGTFLINCNIANSNIGVEGVNKKTGQNYLIGAGISVGSHFLLKSKPVKKFISRTKRKIKRMLK